MSYSQCSSDLDSFGFNSENSFLRRNTKYPFYAHLGEQEVYYTEVQRTNAKSRLPEVKKKKKRSVFSKAFQWCVKERELCPKRTDKRTAKGDETVNLTAFASWLDLKYQEFLKETADKNKPCPTQYAMKSDAFTSPSNLTSMSTTTRTIRSKTETRARMQESHSSLIKVTDYPKTTCPYYDNRKTEGGKKTDKTVEISCLCRNGVVIETPSSTAKRTQSRGSSSSKTSTDNTVTYIPCGMAEPHGVLKECPAMFTPCFVRPHGISMAQSPLTSEVVLMTASAQSEPSKTVHKSTSDQTDLRNCASPAIPQMTTATAVNTVTLADIATMTQTTIPNNNKEYLNSDVQTSQHSIQMKSIVNTSQGGQSFTHTAKTVMD